MSNNDWLPSREMIIRGYEMVKQMKEPIPPPNPETQARLSKITQEYIREREKAAFREWFDNPLLNLMLRNAEAKMADAVKEVTMDDVVKEPYMFICGVEIPAEPTENPGIVALLKPWRGMIPGLVAISYLEAELKQGGYLYQSSKRNGVGPGLIIMGADPAAGPDNSACFERQSDGSLRQIPCLPPIPGVFYATPEAEIPVTDEMTNAGYEVGETFPDGDNGRALVDHHTYYGAIYRAMRALETPPLLYSADGTISRVPEVDAERFKALMAERDQAIASRDMLQVRLAGSEERNQILLKHYRKVCDALHTKKSPDIVTQTLMGDTTYTVFATDPQTVHADHKHTPADVKAPPPPKPFPAGALKPSTTDPRRVGQ